jgi:hypothetical protein
MIWNFKNFSLLENYGIPEFSKDLSTKIISALFSNGFKSYIQKINYKEIENIKEIQINILNIKEDYSSKFVANKDNPFVGIIMEFDIPKKSDPLHFHEVLIHEITHLFEFYNIFKNNRDLPLYDKIKRGLINTLTQDNIDIFSYFRNLVYLTLDNELNARVSQTYIYLKNSKLTYDQLKNCLYTSRTWKRMEEIKKFHPFVYKQDIVDKIGVGFSIYLVNSFNDELNKNDLPFKFDKITSEEELWSYFKWWKNRFNIKLRKHKNKLIKLVNSFL